MNLKCNGEENLIISIVELKTNTGIYDCGILSGIPNVDNVKASKLYQELIEDCGCTKYVLVSVKSVTIAKQDASITNEEGYAIIPEEEYVFRGKENDVQRRNHY